VWLSTVRPDGCPHLIPIWFLWDGERIIIFSKPEASKVANLRRHPQVMLAVGDPEHDFDVQLIEGIAVPLEASTADVITPEHERKYGELMARIGLTPAEYARTYSQPIVVRPTRFLPWAGRGHAERGYVPVDAVQERV
jgi:PPOX class probable F420-dependent enzyme